jgi:hypothetical protein
MDVNKPRCSSGPGTGSIVGLLCIVGRLLLWVVQVVEEGDVVAVVVLRLGLFRRLLFQGEI